MLIDVNKYTLKYTRPSKVPEIVVWLEFDYKQEYVKALKDAGYNKKLNPFRGIVNFPIKMVIYPEEYEEPDEYFETFVETLTSMIEEPAFAVLNCRSDDLRLEQMAKFILNLFDFKNSKKLLVFS